MVQLRLLASALLLGLLRELVAARIQLKFSTHQVFKILQLTDLHYGGSLEEDAATDILQARLLELERPDLVVFSGDLVSGYLWNHTMDPQWFSRRWQQLIKPVQETDIPWAVTLGNHDAEADLAAEQLADLTRAASPASLPTQELGALEGVTNLHLDILASEGGSTAARVWLLDSLEYGCQGQPGWGCVGPRTTAWLQSQAEQLPSAPSLAFIHIPIPDFLDAWNDGVVKGSKRELVNCPSANSGLVPALLAANVSAVFSGHDHDNNYDGMHASGIRLAYGHKTGYGSYGPPAEWLKGARMLLLREGQEPRLAESWIRLENGSRIDQAQAAAEEVAAQRQTVCDASARLC